KKFVHWCADRFGLKRLSHITARMLRAYAEERLGNLKPNSIRTHLAAIVKLAEAKGKGESFSRVSRRIQSALPDGEENRPSYLSEEEAAEVLRLVEQSDARLGLAMRVQLETACRLCEVVRLRSEDMLGYATAKGETVGTLRLNGKGGRIRYVEISVQTYRR